MVTPHAPRRLLPANPSKEHLRKQAKRLAAAQQLQLAAAQRRLAAEYGHQSWAALMRVVDAAAAPAMSELPPLSAAAMRADEAAVRELLSRGEAPEGAAGDVNTPLWHVCKSDAPVSQRIAVAGLLLDAGASPRRACEGNATALHAAAQRGPLALVELLIRRGAMWWQPDRRGKGALDYARKGSADDREAIVELLDRPVIRDGRFRAAVKAIHAGDVGTLSRLLAEHPGLMRERAVEPDCYPPSYFRNPKLFWFVANNPTLLRRMPAGIVEVAAVMVARGVEKLDLDYALELVMSNGQTDVQSRQPELIALLLEAGATATPQSILVALAHGCFEPIHVLLERGHPATASIAASLGRNEVLAPLLTQASPQERQEAFGLAVINRQLDAARACLDAGADVNHVLPVHRHSMPLHQAVINEDVQMMELLVERGANFETRDTLWNSTPLGWAQHGKHTRAEEYLRSLPRAAA